MEQVYGSNHCFFATIYLFLMHKFLPSPLKHTCILVSILNNQITNLNQNSYKCTENPKTEKHKGMH